ncbi:uncharacterized protein C8Q71DRAFT_66152 [Rhodofomes roseus]|uniref:Uncharacterized protein n=1 Tax=Rhodofomes roseus TaxID=34475 RepID=A0ABQ8KED5_9APHY|nr:uncharacterized protein C8Q71DRAFT_66152 [Rhodofomes roseus]KAH9836099.1 hypothetical protein C8Q71DRAFT_66152 [Rhodofomes roseus]
MVVDDDWHIVGLIGCQWEEAYPSTPASAIAMHAGRDATPGSDQSLVGAAGRLYDVPHSVESTERPWSEYLRSVFLWSNEVRVALILVTATDHNLKSLLDLNDAEVQPYKLCAIVTDRPIPASIRSRLDLQTVVITARPTSTLNRHQTRDQYLPRVLSQKPHIILLAGSCQTLALRNYLRARPCGSPPLARRPASGSPYRATAVPPTSSNSIPVHHHPTRRPRRRTVSRCAWLRRNSLQAR